MEVDRRSFLAQSAGALAVAAIVPNLAEAAFSAAEPIDVAVVGVGRQGRAIIGELSGIEGVNVVAICDTDERRLKAGLRRVQDAQPYADHRAMLDAVPTIAAVFVATPTHLHRGVAEDALGAGKHVYIEAPLASTIDDAQAIAAAARSSDKVVQGGYLARSNPVYKLARTFYRSDSVRELISMHASRARKTSWRAPANSPERDKALNWRLDPEITTGLAGEWGSHQFETFHFYLDRYPVAVTGGGAIRLHDDGRKVDDTIHCALEFENGATLTYDATLCNSYGGAYELFRGSNAAIKLGWSHGWMFKEADAPTQGWEVYANRQQFHNDEGITLIADATQLASQGKLKEGIGLSRTSLFYGIEAFFKSIQDGEAVACTPDQAARTTAVGILTHQAITTGNRVEITKEALGG